MPYSKGDAFVLDNKDFYLALGPGTVQQRTYHVGGLAEATQLADDLVYALEGIFADEPKVSEADKLKARISTLEKLLLRILAEADPQIFRVVMRQELQDSIRETLLEGLDIEHEEVKVT